MWFVESYGLLGLFFLCFLAATIFPLSSEVVVTALLLTKTHDPIHILVVATIGNSLGGFVNYAMGYYGGLTWFKRHRAVWKNISSPNGFKNTEATQQLSVGYHLLVTLY
jgi:membrane protein YqaA with SNARE-associated domain